MCAADHEQAEDGKCDPAIHGVTFTGSNAPQPGSNGEGLCLDGSPVEYKFDNNKRTRSCA